MIALISGTNRPGGSTRKVAAEIERIFDELGEPLKLLDLVDLPADVFLPSSYSTKPPSFTPWNQAVLESDGLIVVTPEYNGGMPGVLKYFIDLLQFPESLHRKPVCFVGIADGVWGALRPVEQLQQIFGYRHAHIYPERVFIPHVNGVLDSAGRLADQEIVGRLRNQAKGFIRFYRTLESAHQPEQVSFD